MKAGIDYTGVAVVAWQYDENDDVLLHVRGPNCRDEKGRWDIFGGRLELGESVEACLIREMLEEFGVRPLKTERLGYRDVHRLDDNGNKTHWLALDFKVLIDSELVLVTEHDKILTPTWFKRDKIPLNLSTALVQFRKVYKDKL
jgi:8-oxo-dGTP pyrophosphatase MutT (NUDIX family)